MEALGNQIAPFLIVLLLFDAIVNENLMLASITSFPATFLLRYAFVLILTCHLNICGQIKLPK